MSVSISYNKIYIERYRAILILSPSGRLINKETLISDVVYQSESMTGCAVLYVMRRIYVV